MKKQESQVRGIVRNVNLREEDSDSVLSFRVEQADEEGNITNYTEIEHRDYILRGSLVNGDEVEVTGIKDEQGIVKSTKIHNLKTNAVITQSRPKKGILIFLLPFLFMLIGLAIRPFEGAVIGFIIGGVFTVFIFIFLSAINGSKNR